MRKRLLYLALALFGAPLLWGQSTVVCTTSSPGTVIGSCASGASDPLSLANITGTTSNCGGAASGSANSVCLSSNAVTGEGATADTSETVLAFGDATVDQTLTCTGAASSFGCVVAAPAAAASSTAGNGLALTASAATAGSSNAGAAAGGSVTITAGAAARLSSGNANGGDINLTPGAGIGTGTSGKVISYGRLLVTDGTAALPALHFASSLTSGIYVPVSNQLSIAANGSEWIRFDNNSVNHGPKAIGWSASFGTADLGLSRAAAGVLTVTNGSTGIGATLTGVSVETVATTKAPAITESAELYTNGADVDGQAITLPNDPTVGVCYEFALTSTDTSNSMAIAPSAGETLMDAATTCSTSFSATAKGATARICAVSGGSGGLWLVMSKNGTWTCS